jgi:hypothetical protein
MFTEYREHLYFCLDLCLAVTMASSRPVVVSEVGLYACNLCNLGGGQPHTLCTRVHNLYICFACAGQILTAIQTQAVFIEKPDGQAG